MAQRYDRLGLNYANMRKPDPRIAATIHQALGDAETIVNVGAGTGSYEPQGRAVTAVEPSWKMISQRRSAAPMVCGIAEHLPFPDQCFDAAMAILTIHHWADRRKGLTELRRVTRGPIIVLTSDPDHPGSWLGDYLPEVRALDRRVMPALADLQQCLGGAETRPLQVPYDCSDGFLYAYWRRPHAYLEEDVLKGSSAFWLIGDVSAGLTQLRADLDSGEWADRYGDLLSQQTLDVGYRLLVSPA